MGGSGVSEPRGTAHRIGIYGEIDANLIDGSAIWLQAVGKALASLPDVSVFVLLRAVPKRDVVIAELRRQPCIQLIEPAPADGRLLTSTEAAAALEAIDDQSRLTALLVRGAATLAALAERNRLSCPIWAYHVPSLEEEIERGRVALLSQVAARVLCQTDAVRHHVVGIEPALESRIVLLPPIVDANPLARTASRSTAPRLVYAGKLSPEYCFEEMLTLLAQLREQIPGTELHIAGDKIHDPPQDRGFRARARAALERTPGLHWHRALERPAVFELMRRCDIGLSLRDHALDSSLEISTKLLEYGSAGLPVVLNPQARHRELLGTAYPLYASDVESAQSAVLRAWEDPVALTAAADRCVEASEPYHLDRVSARLGDELLGPRTTQPRVLVAGHQLAFFGPVRSALDVAGWEVREDRWTQHARHDAERSRALAADAEVVLCEWCLGNAVWYAARRRPGQRLLVRFHRSELTTPYPERLDIAAVDQVVFVSAHVRDEAAARFGWPLDRLSVLPNAIDTRRFARRKLPGSETALLVVGYVPRLKRLDRALDVLEAVRFRDPRFRLLIKGTPPWEYDWMRTREDERRYYASLFLRIRESPLLGSAVCFEPAGPDIPDFLQRGRFILSTSDVEGHSVAVAEAMASGCVPLVLDRAGAREQYGDKSTFADPRAAAREVLDLRDGDALDRAANAAAARAAQWDVRVLLPEWKALLGKPD